MKLLAITILGAAFATSTFAQRPITVFLAGDSTMAAKADDKRPETGWGEMLEKRFKPGTVKVDNRAMNGRSTTSFIAEGRWKALIDSVKKGDLVFIQFGHNDQKKDKPGVYAAPEAYKANLSGFVNDVRAKGATPVLMTSIARRRFEAGKVVQTHGEYPDLVKAVAKDHNVAVIDLGRKTEAVLAREGEEGSKKLFFHLKPGENANYPKGVEDNTHLSPYGADVFARLAIEGIRESKLAELTRHFIDQ
jgi:lysophospholipase L1-like esterase